eukprot:Seg2731.4 transcript_id=Seg2731.4/GoldUCD/mRNA.D3Y31 product="hypothetical protein" protein_id=Seg2731.4/GoldUCD/D3Y31
MSSCCTEWNAQSAIGSKDATMRLREPWERLANIGELPGLEQQSRYKIYTLRSEKYAGHISVVFSHEDRRFIAISLNVEEKSDAGPARAYPVTQILDSHKHAAKLVFCGELTSSANQILAFATQAMKQLGDYNWLTNNCQDYANKFLKNLGIEDRPMTDVTKGTIGAGSVLATVLVAVGSIIVGIFGKRH